MLHIVKQFIFGLSLGLKSEFAGEVPSGIDTQETGKKKVSTETLSTQEAQEIITDTQDGLNELYNEVELNKLTTSKFYLEKTGDTELKQGMYDSTEVMYLQMALIQLNINLGTTGYNNNGADADFGTTLKGAIENLQISLKLPVDGTFNHDTKVRLLKAVDSEILERNSTKSQKENQEIVIESKKTKTIGNQSFTEKRTREHRGRVDSMLDGNMDKASYMAEINMESFEAMVLKHGIDKVYISFKSATDKNAEVKDGDYMYTPFNTGDEEESVESLDYDFNSNFFTANEVASLEMAINDIKRTQENIKNNVISDTDKLGILIDFDKDGKLEKGANFTYGELQSDYLINQGLTREGMETFFTNLGLDKDDIFEMMGRNLIKARNTVKERLATLGEMEISMAELVTTNGAKEAMVKRFETIDKYQPELKTMILAHLGDLIANDPQAQDREDISNKDLDDVLVALTYEGLSLGFGDIKSGAISAQVHGKMQTFVDSISLSPHGFSLNKNFLNENGFKINGSLANLVFPVGNASYSHRTDDGLVISPSLTMASGLTVAAIGVSGFDDTTTAIGGKMEELNVALHNVLENKEDLTDEEKLLEKQIAKYYGLKPDKISETDFKKMIARAIEKQTEATMYNNAEGTKLSSLSIGLLSLSGYELVPLIGVGLESIGISWDKHMKHELTQRDVTRKSFKLSDIGVIDSTIDEKNTTFIPTTGEVKILAPANVQVKRIAVGYHIGGNLENINISEITTNESVTFEIKLNNSNEEAELVDTITNSSTTKTLEITENKERIAKLSGIRSELSNLITHDTVTSKYTEGFAKLQKDIFTMAQSDKGNYSDKSVNTAWEQVIKVFSLEKNIKYLGQETKELINDLNKITNLQERVTVLETIQLNFMEKAAITFITDPKSNEVKAELKEKIVDYDIKKGVDYRGKHFDELFKKSGFNDISLHRKNWVTANAKATSYNVSNAQNMPGFENSVAFVGVETKLKNSTNISGVMTYVGDYHIANLGETSFVEIPEKDDKIVYKLPDAYVQGYVDILIKAGASKDLTTGELKLGIIEGILHSGNQSFELDYELAFARMGECLNDAVIFKGLNIVSSTVPTLNGESASTINEQNIDVEHYNFAWADLEKKDQPTETPTEEPTDGPTEEPTTDPTTEPTVPPTPTVEPTPTVQPTTTPTMEPTVPPTPIPGGGDE